MRRLVRLFAAAAIIASLVAIPTPTFGAQLASGWSIDHNTRTITFKTELLLYPSCTRPNCQVTDGVVSDIENQIRNMWGKGQKFGCYTIKMDIKVTKGPRPPGNVPSGVIGIRIDRSSVDFVSFVTDSGSSGRWDSDDPGARVVAVNSTTSPTTWGYSSDPNHPTDANTYAHEFGHILGLDDTYQRDANGNVIRDANGDPIDIPGSPHDLMNSGMNDGSPVAQATIDRMVKRAGIKASDLLCAYRLKYDRGGVHVKGVKCGGPGGTWKLKEKIDVAVGQEFKLEIEIDPSDLKGVWYFADVLTAPRTVHRGKNNGSAAFRNGTDTTPPMIVAEGIGDVPVTPLSECPPN